MDLLGMKKRKHRQEIKKHRDGIKLTVLCRKGGTWGQTEVFRLTDGLRANISIHPDHLECLIVFGHFTKEQTLKALGGGLDYTATQVTGIDNKDLPFSPGFAI